MALCILLSLFGTPGASVLRHGLHASTFLPCLPSDGFCCPALPRPSRSRIGTMRALTPAALRPRIRPLRSIRLAVPASRPQPRNAARWSRAHHLVPPAGPLSPGFAIHEQARRCTPPNRVRSPTGCRFASGCSPPRLAATQLPSATCAVTSHGTDSHYADITNSRTHLFRGVLQARTRNPARPIGLLRSSKTERVVLDSGLAAARRPGMTSHIRFMLISTGGPLRIV